MTGVLCEIHGSASIVDCGVAGFRCWQCEDLYGDANLRKVVGPAWSCPVCDRVRDACSRIVIHHDHFAEAVWAAIPRERRKERIETFGQTAICELCNSIDAIAKKEIPKLPRWFSLSPDDMRTVRLPDGSVDLDRVVAVWNERRTGTFAEKMRALVESGIDRQALKDAFEAYQRQRPTRVEVAEEVARLRRKERVFSNLFREKGNDAALVAWLIGLGWERPRLHSFVYLYHRYHGDPELNDRPEDFGTGQFLDWVVMAVKDPDGARDYRERCAYWRRKAAASGGQR